MTLCVWCIRISPACFRYKIYRQLMHCLMYCVVSMLYIINICVSHFVSICAKCMRECVHCQTQTLYGHWFFCRLPIVPDPTVRPSVRPFACHSNQTHTYTLIILDCTVTGRSGLPAPVQIAPTSQPTRCEMSGAREGGHQNENQIRITYGYWRCAVNMYIVYNNCVLDRTYKNESCFATPVCVCVTSVCV